MMTPIRLLLVTLFLLPLSSAYAQLGIIADDATDSAVVFDAGTDTVVGSVLIGPGTIGGGIGDCAITSDQTLGMVADNNHQLWFVDLTTSPPSLAAGTNPVPIQSPGLDVSLSPFQNFVVICDGSSLAPVSVVDIDSRTEVDTFDLGHDCNSVDVCSDGSVLVTSATQHRVRRLMIDPTTGTLSDTGERGSFIGPQNIYCSPDASTGMVLHTPGWVGGAMSFSIPGLTVRDSLSNNSSFAARTGAFSPDGAMALIGHDGGSDFVEAYSFDPATGLFGLSPLFTLPLTSIYPAFGIDQIAFHPDGSKFYVTDSNVVTVHNPAGTHLASITDPDIVIPTGVCVSPPPECGNSVLEAGEDCDDGNLVDGDGCDSNCTDTGCGNGIVTGTEQCDDANAVEGDGCDSNCTPSACGNGIMGGAEECDDGNNDSCDGCSGTCEDEGFCGDGSAHLTCEVCDDGGESVACDTDCTATSCGDGTVNATAGEACDEFGESASCDADCTDAMCGDGTFNRAAGEGCDDGGESATCDADCTPALCGDGTFNATRGEACDDAGESATCNADCTAAFCGDGTLNATAGEGCDDGGESAACDADCTAAFCGDGTFNGTAGEACDDGGESAACDADCTAAFCGDGTFNATAGEACDDGGPSATCDIDCTAAFCGDGMFNALAGEACDDGGPSAACDADCTAAFCGDGTFNAAAGEACDDGGPSAACDADCTAAFCGDGTFNAAAGEACDDGGPSAACDADCTAAFCGDGTFNAAAGEACDDGGDSAACDADCTAAFCGDGTFNAAAGEACDDGGESGTCNSNCTLALCGDGVLNQAADEVCDDGNGNSGDGCEADCTVTVAADVGTPLAGSMMHMRDQAGHPERRRMTLYSKDRSIQAPAAGSAGDPRENGAVLDIFNPSTGESDTFALPAGRAWRPLGRRPTAKHGWLYMDLRAKYGPCYIVMVRPGRSLYARCSALRKPIDFSLDEQSQGEMAATFQFGSDAAMCMHFGPESVRHRHDRGTGMHRRGRGVFKASKAPAPDTCPVP
jgi:cysteine-rich repeat protein